MKTKTEVTTKTKNLVMKIKNDSVTHLQIDVPNELTFVEVINLAKKMKSIHKESIIQFENEYGAYDEKLFRIENI
jgi:hypothetical protein